MTTLADMFAEEIEAGMARARAEMLEGTSEHTLNADLNAAKNILEAASLTDSLNACGGDVRPRGSRKGTTGQTPVKQELGTADCSRSDRGPSRQRAAAEPHA